MKPADKRAPRRRSLRSGGALHTSHLAALPDHVTGSSSVAVGDIAEIDVSRTDRTCFPEIIYCQNKQVDQIAAIAGELRRHTGMALGTRCPAEFFPALRKLFPRGHFVRAAACFRVGPALPRRPSGLVGLISAGTTDIRACEEAALVLESLGVRVERIYDVGVAGIHRLFASDARIRDADVLIAAAGMEGALPSVLGGLYPQPIIAIPTSTGYGAALAGFTALFSMLTACAPGVTVVNIDNGVGAAAAAFKILSMHQRR